MKVSLDANILFSAANPRWLTRQLLDALEAFCAELMSSAYAWDEAERNVRSHFPEYREELGKLTSRLGWIEDKALSEDLPPDHHRRRMLEDPALLQKIFSQCKLQPKRAQFVTHLL